MLALLSFASLDRCGGRRPDPLDVGDQTGQLFNLAEVFEAIAGLLRFERFEAGQSLAGNRQCGVRRCP